MIGAIAREQRRAERGGLGPAVLGLDLGAARSPPRGSRWPAARARSRGRGERASAIAREAARAPSSGVTGVDFALAETGTLILLSGAGRPRSTSLLPDVHVAVFDRDRLLESRWSRWG